MAEMSHQQQVQMAEQLQQQLEQLEDQQAQLREYVGELESTQEAIDTIGEAEADEEILIPLGSGAFVHARLTDPDHVVASLGSGVMAEEAPSKASERLQSRIKEAEGARQRIQDNMDRLQSQLEELVQSLQSQMAEQQQQGGQGPGQGRGKGPGGPGPTGAG